MTEHVASPAVLVRVFAALIVLTVVTVAVAFVDLEPFSTAIALTIATVKAILVLLIFMELRESPGLTWIAVGGALFFLVVLIVFTMSDYISRGWLGFPGK